MPYRFSSAFSLLLLGMLLAAGLSGCSLYHKVVHPYRLPTPRPSPEYLAKQKADKKARKALAKEAKATSKRRRREGNAGVAVGPSGLLGRKKAPQEVPDVEGATDQSSPTASATPAAAGTAATATETRTLPEKSTIRYDKHQMIKNRPKLMRRRIHKNRQPFRPWQSIRNFFKFGLHAKPNYSPDHKPKPKEPVLAPDAPAPAGEPGGPPAAPGAGPAPAPGGPPPAPDAGPKL